MFYSKRMARDLPNQQHAGLVESLMDSLDALEIAEVSLRRALDDHRDDPTRAPERRTPAEKA